MATLKLRGVPMPLSAGTRISLSGLQLVWQDPRLRGSLIVSSLAIGLLVTLLQGLGIWQLWEVTSLAPAIADGWWDTFVYGARDLGVWLLRILGTMAVLVVSPYLVIQILSVIIPVLSEKLFRTGLVAALPTVASAWDNADTESVVKTLARSVGRLFRVLGLVILGTVVGWLPVVGQIFAIGIWLYTARAIGTELFDPLWERADQREKQYRMQRNFLLGFGLPSALLFSIPLIGPLLFPALQISAGYAAGKYLLEDGLKDTVQPQA